MAKILGQQPVLRTIASTSIALLIVLTLSSPVEAGARKRFLALLEVVQTGPPVADARCPFPTVLVPLTGSGVASRLGRVSLEASHCIIDDPAEGDFNNGILVMSNRRGQLFIEYAGTDTAGDLDGNFVITSGSGEYAAAIGEGTLSGIGLSEEGRGFVTLVGTISFP